MNGARAWVLAPLLAAAVLAAHWPATGGRFHYDDTFAIVENPSIRVWQPLVYFTSPAAGTSWVDAPGYRPLTVASFALNYAWGGLDPQAYLIVNLLLHLAVSWMVFVVGRLLVADGRWAALAALLFALHPINAEAVNYVVARSSLLSTLGVLLAFGAFLRRVNGGGWGWLAGGLVAFAVALLSKESAIALIVPLLAYPLIIDRKWADPGDGRRAARASVIAALWFVGVALVYLALWWSVAGRGVVPEAEGRAAYPVWIFLELAGRSLLLWVWPWPLGLDHPLVFVEHFDGLVAGLLVAGVVGVLAMMIVGRRYFPLGVWALLWAVAGLLPLLPLPWLTTRGLLQENRIAFSAVGLAWVSALVIRAGWGFLERRFSRFRALPWVGVAVGTGFLAAAVGIDRERAVVWHDDRLLWEEVARHAPRYPVAQLNVGTAYLKSGEEDRAEAAFRRVLDLNPDYARAHYNLGFLAMRRGRYEAARTSLERAIALEPGYTKAYVALGTLDMEQGRPAAAAAAFRRAAALKPRDAQTYAQFALLAQRAGDAKTAEGAYREALRYDPDNPEIHNHLGALYLDRRDWSHALEQFTAAIRGDPGHMEAAFNRAVALYRLGRVDEAAVAIQALLPRVPPDPKFDPYRRAAQAILRAGGGGADPPAVPNSEDLSR